MGAIERQFAAAQRPPVHKTRPDLQPVKVQPVLPDMDLWPNDYVQVAFDTDPTPDFEPYGRLTPENRRRLAARSSLKIIQLDKTRLLGLLVSRGYGQALARGEGQLSTGGPPELGPHDWVREYHYEKHVFEEEEGAEPSSRPDPHYLLT